MIAFLRRLVSYPSRLRESASIIYGQRELIDLLVQQVDTWRGRHHHLASAARHFLDDPSDPHARQWLEDLLK